MALTARLTALSALLAAPMLLVAAASLRGESPSSFTVEMARKLIAERGAAKTAEQVSGDSAILEVVASGVAGASEAWLDIGVQLLGPAEGYLKDRLLQSFNYALQHDARAVLARTASGVPVEAVCGYDPFSALDNPPALSEFYGAVAQRERAVVKVKGLELQGAKAACLTALAQLKTSGGGRYKP